MISGILWEFNERTVALQYSALHASLEESFGMSVLEAMVIGTPVFGGNRSGNIPALLDQGRAGVLCDISNPEAIAAAMSEILLNEAQARGIAEAAVAYSDAHYSQGATVSAYLEYYAEILDAVSR